MRRRMDQADIDDAIEDRLTTAEQNEVVQLRRDKHQLEMEDGIGRRALPISPGAPSRNDAPGDDRHGGWWDPRRGDMRGPRVQSAGLLQGHAIISIPSYLWAQV